jgi:ATP-dependent protease ClpP protease subunit
MRDIYLEGTVGLAMWPDDPHFTAADLRRQMPAAGDVTVHINSGGGIAAEGLSIYHAIRAHPGRVRVVVTGTAASAASLIVMAAAEIVMLPGTTLMIHDPAVPFTDGRGTEDEHRDVADMLAKLSDGYAAIYAARAGIGIDDARAIMRAETWFTAEEAVAAGFADRVGLPEDGALQAAASFPYRVYANAPPALLVGCRAGGPAKRAVLAMMCGAAAPKSKETSMTKAIVAADTPEDEDLMTATAAQNDDEDPQAAAEDEAEAAAPVAAASDDDDDKDDEDEPMAAAEVVAIIDLVAMHRDPLSVARAFIADKTPLAGVIAHYREKGPSVTRHTTGGATARILRDERETRKAGMTEALTAQLMRKGPASDKARPFMDMRLVEMAAVCGGYKGPMRNVRDMETAFMAGTHTTSDFPAIFSNALNKQLESRYRDAVPTYRSIARQVSFADLRPHPQIRTGDFPMLQEIGNGGEIKFGTFSDKQESVAVESYASGVRLTRQMLINDDLNAIAQVIADQGRMVARKEDALFYAMLLSGANANGPTLAETTRQVFNTTDLTLAGTPAAITVPSLNIGRASLRKRKSLDGGDLEIVPAILLVGPDKELEAQQVVAPIQAQQAGNVNPFSGTLQVVTTAKITGNAWYLFADPSDVPNFVYGYLSGYEAPRMRMDEPFGYQGTALTIEHDFGVGAVDFRGGYKNAGA